MKFTTVEECGRYVDAELAQVVGSLSGWHTEYFSRMNVRIPPTSPERPGIMVWRITQGSDPDAGWYQLDARMEDHEFVLWYGCQRVGADGLHWILRPALHIAFDDLYPTAVPLLIRFSLGSVLAEMIASLDAAPFRRPFFPLNTFSLT